MKPMQMGRIPDQSVPRTVMQLTFHIFIKEVIHKLHALPPVLAKVEDIAGIADADADQYGTGSTNGMVAHRLSGSGNTMTVADFLR
jgi:hypothetical protein